MEVKHDFGTFPCPDIFTHAATYSAWPAYLKNTVSHPIWWKPTLLPFASYTLFEMVTHPELLLDFREYPSLEAITHPERLLDFREYPLPDAFTHPDVPVVRPFAFLELPEDLRIQVYSNLTHDLKQTPQSRSEFHVVLTQYMLTSRQFYSEFRQAYYGWEHWWRRLHNTLHGPRRKPASTCERSLLIYRWAMQYKVAGRLEGRIRKQERPEDADYWVNLRFGVKNLRGYTVQWKHLDERLRKRAGISVETYKQFVERVEAAAEAMTTQRREIDGRAGCTDQGVNELVDAFYFCGEGNDKEAVK